MALEFASGDGGEILSVKACVAFGVNDLRPAEIDVGYPKAGEVRLRVLAEALCHTDVYTLRGDDAEGAFPSILGHEATAVVEALGEGVEGLELNDLVVPAYTPECRQGDCIFCQSVKTNLCPRIRSTQGKGVMPDGTTRFRLKDGTPVYHFMGTSTMAEYTVVAAISCAKINPRADPLSACLLGCGIPTGWGAVFNTAKVESGSSVAVFGLGAVGLAAVQAAKVAGASRIYAIDVNPGKFPLAESFGATDCINPNDHEEPIQKVLVDQSPAGWGIDYTFDATGNVSIMRAALEASHRGWGKSVIIGVAASGQEVATRPFQFVTGRSLTGTAFGGYKSRTAIPELVEKVLSGEMPIDAYITHRFKGVEKLVEAVDALHAGDCLRAVVEY